MSIPYELLPHLCHVSRLLEANGNPYMQSGEVHKLAETVLVMEKNLYYPNVHNFAFSNFQKNATPIHLYFLKSCSSA